MAESRSEIARSGQGRGERERERDWNVQPFDPFRELGFGGTRLGQILDEFFAPVSQGGGQRRGWPAVDIDEDEDSHRICLEVPGVRREDIDVEIQQGIEPRTGSTQLADLPAQSHLAECGSNVDPARITIEPDKRSGKRCIRGLRITVGDLLEYLASGMSEDEILHDFPDLERKDIRAALAFAAAKEERAGRHSVE